MLGVGSLSAPVLQRGPALPLVLLHAVWRAGPALGALTAFLVLSMVVPSIGKNIFDSPDETSNYIFAQTFADEGRLWYEKDYSYLDDENLLHPRGALTYNDRVVPFNFLGLPVMYGFAQKVIGDHIRVIAFVLAAVCAWALYRAANLMFGAQAWETWIVAVAFTPLIYYLNHPYMNATLAITFLSLAVWVFVRYYRFSIRRDLVLAAIFLALGIFCRYEYALFIPPLAAWALYLKHRTFLSKAYIADVTIFGVGLSVLFIVPVAVLNQLTYGDWKTYGYALFNSVYFPERSAAGGLSVLENAGRAIRGVLLPSYPFEPSSIFMNLSHLTIFLLPVFTLLALLGAGMVLRAYRRSLWLLLPIGLMLVYIIIYRGSNDTWRAFSAAPDYNAAAVRYWLPFYLVLFFLATYALVTVKDVMIRGVFIVGLVLTGPTSVYWTSNSSLVNLKSAIESYEEWGETILVPNTEPNAIIYAGRGDKRIVPFRDVAAWWSGEEFYAPGIVAASMARVSAATGRPLYLVGEKEVNIEVLGKTLAQYDLALARIGRTSLYKLTPLVQP